MEFGITLLLNGTHPTVASGLLRLLWLMAGGVGAGLLLGYLMTFVEQWIDEGPLEMVVSLIVPYIAYIAAEEIKASGVLAVVACGLFLSRRSAQYLSAPARLEILSAWKALDFILNGVVFLLIGLQLPYILGGIRGTSIRTLIFYGGGFSLLLIALRMAWAFPGAYASIWFRRRILHKDIPNLGKRSVFLVGWTGMRGVLSLAAAFSLPWTLSNGEPFAQRNLIVFLTFCIIFVTLVLQGLTLPPLIRLLKLNNNRELEQEEYLARCRVLATAIESLTAKRNRASSEDEAHDIDDMLHLYEHRLKAIEGKEAKANPEKTIDPAELKHLQRRKKLAKHTAEIERHALHEMREDGSIGDEVIRILERELDLTETRFLGIE
jgi:CPA1 family monovalent cation:H+ antiporter